MQEGLHSKIQSHPSQFTAIDVINRILSIGIASFNGVQMEIAVQPANLLKLGRHLGPTLVSVSTIEYLEALTELNSVCVR